MKGLLQYMSPFAPDQSGATSVLYDLEGITVILDAGGCIGNICGFDEPRWFDHSSALFSAGLRDMDAILGRDDKTVGKLQKAAARVNAKFAALVGTPVPAVIATDTRALARMAQKRCGFPVISIECTGTNLYDEGEEKTYDALFDAFLEKDPLPDGRTVGIFGTTPLDVSRIHPEEAIKELFPEVLQFFFYDHDIDVIRHAGCAKINYVCSPSGLKMARKLKERCGTPYQVMYPFVPEIPDVAGKRVLIIHQQIAAHAIRKTCRYKKAAEVICGTWFMQDPEFKEPQDVKFTTEAKFIDYVKELNPDVIIADDAFRRPLADFTGTWVSAPHFAVSGELDHE